MVLKRYLFSWVRLDATGIGNSNLHERPSPSLADRAWWSLNALNEWLRRRDLSPLVYIWVAENVRNENPHLHLLTSYQVPRSEFGAFASHVESLWGHGFAKIERVRKPAEAGRYMMKTPAYTMKGAEDDQGTVIGNRYGISREILPKYETLDVFDGAAAADGLRLMRGGMHDGIEEIRASRLGT